MNKKINFSFFEWICISICALQILFLMFSNIVYMKGMVDYDSSCALLHAMEIWKQKTLFISDWGYQTTIDLDSIVGLVAILYGISGNIFIAQALGNNIIIALYVYVLIRIFKNIDVSIFSTAFGIFIFFIPYSLVQLGYVPMLFSNGAFYTIRGLIPLLLLGIVLEIQNEVKVQRYIFRYIFLCIMAFFSGLSSGVYILMCGIFPFIVYECIQTLISGNIHNLNNKRLKAISVVCICSIIGVVSERIWGFTTKATNMVLVDRTNWVANISSCIVGIYELFGGVVTEGKVPLLSLSGVNVLCNWFLTTIYLSIAIYMLVQCVRKKSVDLLSGFILSVFVINILVLTLLFTTYGGGTFEFRYHIIPMLLVLILSVKRIDALFEVNNILSKNVILFILCASVLISAIIGDFNCSKEWSISMPQSEVRKIEEVIQVLEENEIGLVVVIGEDNTKLGRKMRVFSNDIDCIITGNNGKSGAPTWWGGTKKKLDNATHPETIAIVTQSDVYDTLPSYLKKSGRLLESVEDVNIYSINKSMFDYVSGFLNTDNNVVDFAYSPGYKTNNAELTDAGTLLSNGIEGFIMWGPYCDGVEGNWNITINYHIREYSMEEDCAAFNLSRAGYDKASVMMEVDRTHVTMENVSISDLDNQLEFRIWVPEGMIIEIESIVMRRN